MNWFVIAHLVSSSQGAPTLWVNRTPVTFPWEAYYYPWYFNGGYKIQYSDFFPNGGLCPRTNLPTISTFTISYLSLSMISSWWCTLITSATRAFQSCPILTDVSSSCSNKICLCLSRCLESLVSANITLWTSFISYLKFYFTLTLCFHTASTDST